MVEFEYYYRFDDHFIWSRIYSEGHEIFPTLSVNLEHKVFQILPTSQQQCFEEMRAIPLFRSFNHVHNI